MTNYMSLTWIFEEKIAPWKFPFIVHPQLAVQRVRSLPLSFVSSMFTQQDTLSSRNGVNPYQS